MLFSTKETNIVLRLNKLNKQKNINKDTKNKKVPTWIYSHIILKWTKPFIQIFWRCTYSSDKKIMYRVQHFSPSLKIVYTYCHFKDSAYWDSQKNTHKKIVYSKIDNWRNLFLERYWTLDKTHLIVHCWTVNKGFIFKDSPTKTKIICNLWPEPGVVVDSSEIGIVKFKTKQWENTPSQFTWIFYKITHTLGHEAIPKKIQKLIYRLHCLTMVQLRYKISDWNIN